MKELLLSVKCLADRPQFYYSLMEIKTDKHLYHDVWYFKEVEREYIPLRVYETNVHSWCKENNVDYYLYEYERDEDECKADRNSKEFSLSIKPKI